MFKLYWELELRDKNGKLIEKRRIRAKSYLRQYLALLKGQMNLRYNASGFAGNSPVIDVSGVSRTCPAEDRAICVSGLPTNAPAGNSDYGLVIGTSDAPNTKNTFAMGEKITHGTGSGQMLYGGHTYEDTTNPSGNDWIFRIIRTFTNNSPASITVKEIGLIVTIQDSSLNQRYFLIARDVITPITVPVGSTLTVRYLPKITVA